MNRRLALVGIAMVGAGDTMKIGSGSRFLVVYFPSVASGLMDIQPLALVLAVAGGFVVGWSLYGVRSLLAVILGVVAAVLVWLLVWWTPS
ncbi:MAG TPA: hypothetical protein VEO18_05960 [Thermoplasmata archaeon]|nr:hypothetical protein [Thermoplasmata archaeon]